MQQKIPHNMSQKRGSSIFFIEISKQNCFVVRWASFPEVQKNWIGLVAV